ncbi:protein ACCELERATED CELL DEATH [Salix suchowensis]|nr:protein ACCELERATED CELL DEATH [Salix suchowensis]
MSRPTEADTKRSASWFTTFQYNESTDKPGDARNVLLVVVALIAAVTFQAGVNPPGGVWQEGDHAGRAIYASQQFAFYVFLISNTLALSSCILVITSLTYRFPFHFEIWVATASMMITYASAVFAVTPHEIVRFRYLLIAASVPFLMRCLGYFIKKYRLGDFVKKHCLGYFFEKYRVVESKSQVESQEEGGEKNRQAGDEQV